MEASQDTVFIEVFDSIDSGCDGAVDGFHRRCPAACPDRIEERHEQVDQLPGQVRVVGQGLFHIGLAELLPGLQPELAVGAQYGDLTPGQPGNGDEPVEAVVLDLAGPDFREAILEGVLHVDGVQLDPALAEHAEIVNPVALLAAGGRDSIGGLLDHLEAHVLEHRQNVGQGYRIAGTIDLEMECVDPHIELRGDIAGIRQFLYFQDVADRRIGVEQFLIGRWKTFLEAFREDQALGFAPMIDTSLPEIVGPQPRSLDDALLDDGDIVAAPPTAAFPATHISLNHAPGAMGGMDDEVDARHHRLGKLDGEFRRGAAEGFQKHRLHALAQRGIVALAGHVDEAGEEPRVIVAPEEQAYPLTLLEMQDAVADLVEIVAVGLEQFVARVGFENVLQRLAVVAALGVGRALEHGFHLVAQYGNIARVAVVGRRSEEPEETPLAGDPALFVERFDADIVHVDRPVDRRPGVRLGDDEKLLAAGKAADCGR